MLTCPYSYLPAEEMQHVMISTHERPRLPERFTLIPVKPGEFRLHSFSYSLALSSKSPNLLARLLPLLDGDHRVSDLLHDLRAYGAESVMDILEQLKVAGILEDAAQTPAAILSHKDIERYHDQITFFSHFAATGQPGAPDAWPDIPRSGLEYQERLKQARVAVFGLGRLGSQLVRSLTLAGVGQITGTDAGLVGISEVNSDAWFEARHIGLPRGEALTELVAASNPLIEFRSITEPPHASGNPFIALSDSTFAVFCADGFNPERYEAFNQACLNQNIQWTSCRLLGFEFTIGPTVIPYKTPCYKCFDLRQKGNLTDYEEYLVLEKFLASGALRSGALQVTPGTGLAALEVVKALTHFMEPVTYAHLYSLNLLSLESKRHPILKLPRCPHCGRPSQPRPTIQAWQSPAEAS